MPDLSLEFRRFMSDELWRGPWWEAFIEDIDAMLMGCPLG